MIGRIRLPRRPDPARLQAARVAAARVGTASAQSAVEEELATVEAAIPADYAETITSINARLDALETPAEP